jgi:hypothetical protein
MAAGRANLARAVEFACFCKRALSPFAQDSEGDGEVITPHRPKSPNAASLRSLAFHCPVNGQDPLTRLFSRTDPTSICDDAPVGL